MNNHCIFYNTLERFVKNLETKLITREEKRSIAQRPLSGDWFCTRNYSIFLPTIMLLQVEAWIVLTTICGGPPIGLWSKVKVKLWFWALYRLCCLTPLILSYNDTAYTCWPLNEDDPINFGIKKFIQGHVSL